MNRDHLDALLRYLVAVGGSDLHLKVGAAPKVRVDGELVPVEGTPVLTPHDTEQVADAILTPLAREQFNSSLDADFAYAAKKVGRFRVNVFRQRGSVGVVMRHVTYRATELADLGLPPVVKRLAEEVRGMILVTGPTGSGKSTTSAGIVDHINRSRNVSMITIEDPIEILHQDRLASVSQREIGTDAESFPRAMWAAMRQDPDVIVVGEMRDTETVAAALAAAETGHLVISSLHTSDAAETVNRIVDFYPPAQHQQVRVALASVLKGTIAQRLVPAIGGGRIAVCETMVVTGRVQQCILEADQTHQIRELIDDGDFYGMQTFDTSLLQLVEAGLISLESALASASNPHDLKVRLGKAGPASPTGDPDATAAAVAQLQSLI